MTPLDTIPTADVDAAVVAYRDDPTDEHREALLAAMHRRNALVMERDAAEMVAKNTGRTR